MANVSLVIGKATFTAASEALGRACALFAARDLPSCHRVQSRVPVGLFRLFFEAIKGNDIQITNEKFQDCRISVQNLAFGTCV
jgi:hypothetical protein